MSEQARTMKPGVTEILGSHGDDRGPVTSGDTLIGNDGREWTVPPVDGVVMKQFEQYVRKSVVRAIKDISLHDTEEADAMRAVYMRDVTAGKYNWDDDLNTTNHVRSARASTAGALHLLYLCIRAAHRDVTEAQVKRLCEENPVAWMTTYAYILGLPAPDLGNLPAPPKSSASDGAAAEPEPTTVG